MGKHRHRPVTGCFNVGSESAEVSAGSNRLTLGKSAATLLVMTWLERELPIKLVMPTRTVYH